MEKIDKVEVVKTEAVESETTEAQTTEETTEPTETTVEEPKMEDEVQMLPMAEVEKRVSGMQSTMAKQMDAMRKEYDAKIDEFKNQLKAKEEELETAKAESISLSQKLDVANEELRKTASALEEKSNALATLNAGVLTPAETEESWRTLKGKEFLDYVNAHKKELSK